MVFPPLHALFEPVSDISYMCQCFMSPRSDLCELSTVQVKQRANECIMALDKLTQINSGMPVHNVLQTQFDWTALQVNLETSSWQQWRPGIVQNRNGWQAERSQTGLKTFCFFNELFRNSTGSCGFGCQNSMDLCKVAAMGHSFGGATVIESLCKEVKFKYEIKTNKQKTSDVSITL